MVPFVELDKSTPQADTPPSVLPMEFPSWTRAEDTHDNPDVRSARLRRRNRKERIQVHMEKDDITTQAVVTRYLGNGLDNRGLLKAIAEPFISGIRDAFEKNKGKESDTESGLESSDDEKNQPTSVPTPAQPAPITPTPELPSAKPTPSPVSPASPPPPPPASTVADPEKLKPTGGVFNPIQPPAESQVSTRRQSSRSEFSTLTFSSVPTSQATSSRSQSLLTPTITDSIPAISSGARKGVDFLPTSQPVVTFTTSTSSTSPPSSSNVFPTPDSELVQGYDHDHNRGTVHPKVEMALISLGSVGATIILGFLGWFIWRCYKRRGGNSVRRTLKPNFARNLSLERPKLFITNTLSRVPILKDRIRERERGWANLGHADLGPFDEKAYVAHSLATQQSQLPGIVVRTDITTRSIHADAAGGHSHAANRHIPKESISSLEPQFNNTLRSGTQLPHARLSDISSLSSGFGDGRFIMDTLNSNTSGGINVALASTIEAPLPVVKRDSVGPASQKRDTIYTEASEDTPPRFRSINSWVRQQTGRVKRAKQRDEASDTPPVPSLPSEQDFGLMMPDGEEPRRADSAVEYGVAR